MPPGRALRWLGQHSLPIYPLHQIGDVAHELRTPLATIEGYTEGVLDGVGAPSEETWALIHDEVGRLKHLVSDLQELSRAEAKQLALHPRPVGPSELIERARARLAPQYVEKGVELRAEAAPDLPMMEADVDRTLQVLVNLLGNALRATPAGGAVSARAWSDTEGITVQVSDTGVGHRAGPSAAPVWALLPRGQGPLARSAATASA